MHYAGWIGKRKFHSQNTSNFSRPHYVEGNNNNNHHRSIWLCVWGKLSQGNHVIPVTQKFEKLHFQNVFRPHWNEKQAFSDSSGLKSVFAKSHFRDVLVWMAGLTVEWSFPAQCERGLIFKQTSHLQTYLRTIEITETDTTSKSRRLKALRQKEPLWRISP